MENNTLQQCVSHWRDKTADSHAMPFSPILQTAYGTGGSCINMFVPISPVAKGISVPISRGGPPILDE